MKKDFYGVIYKISNNINDKVYIGQTTDPINRWSVHKMSYKIKDRSANIMYDDMRKYGIDKFKFEIICKCYNKEELKEKEMCYSKEYNSIYPNGYNMMVGNFMTKSRLREPFKVVDFKLKTDYIWDNGIASLSRELNIREDNIRSLLDGKYKLINKRFTFSSNLDLKYSEELYDELLLSKNNRRFKAIRLSDNYEEISYNQRQFCEKYDLKYKQLNKVLKGERKLHAGWTFEYLD